jgi:hypothetical protein
MKEKDIILKPSPTVMGFSFLNGNITGEDDPLVTLKTDREDFFLCLKNKTFHTAAPPTSENIVLNAGIQRSLTESCRKEAARLKEWVQRKLSAIEMLEGV